MLLYDANSPGPNPVVVRQFILERGGVSLDVEHIDLAGLANRRADYVNNVNPRGEVPALRLDDESVITEITAICAYLDEVAQGGISLFGANAQERAETNMWARRVYMEVAYPMTTWWRGTDMAIEFYQGHRLPATEAQGWMKAQAERGLARLNDDLQGKAFLCGDRFSMADILLYGFVSTMGFVVPWADVPHLEHYTAWRERMQGRPSSTAMMEPLPAKVS